MNHLLTPSHAGKCKSLEYLNLSENLVEELPQELGMLESLEELNVSLNMLRYSSWNV